MSVTVTLDEADKKREYARILQRRKHHDTTTLRGTHTDAHGRTDQPDPNFRYKFVNNRARSVARAKDQGFEVVPQSDPVQTVHGSRKEGAQNLGDGTDVILMREPVELYEMKRAEDEAQQRRLVQGVNEAARENINRMARDEMRTPAHVDVTEDRSVTGPTRTIADPRPRESAK